MDQTMILSMVMIAAFFGGVAGWLRHRVHAFDRRYGHRPDPKNRGR